MAASRAQEDYSSHDDFLQKRNEFKLLRYTRHKKLQYVPLKLVNFTLPSIVGFINR